MIKSCISGLPLAACLRAAAANILLVLAACSPDTNEDTRLATPGVAPASVSAVAGPTTAEVVEITDAEADRSAANIARQVNLTMAEGFEARLWASEKLLADPVAINVDHQGRIWTAITRRSNNSEFDIRFYPSWEFPSVGFETVEDRRNFLRTELAPEKSAGNNWLPDRNQDGSHDWHDLAVVSEEVLLLEDTTGSGRANRSQVFLRDFNSEVTDALGAIYYHNELDELFLAVAPNAWRVKDTDGDRTADTKESLSYGFGVHIGFSGHGMSGMTLGPDGRIYYGIGDIGANVTDADGKQWAYPNQGVVVRSEPDGSNFEVFASGVRNTHEFVFDKYGNLISVDNDGDHEGEHERLVYLVDGSDSGWRTNWQLGKYKDPKNNDYKVWMDESYFKPHFEGQAAHLLPPLAPYHSGPTGMTYNPGTALSDKWRDHFFVVEFVGSAPRSGINAFTLEPKGASFELATDQNILRGVEATGIDFGPDGALYTSDWSKGWRLDGKGRIWKLDTPATADTLERGQTRQLLEENFSGRDTSALADLLHNQDMRVRSKAQFELVERGALSELTAAAEQREHQLARIHGLWGIGQIARADTESARHLMPYLDDQDPEIRAQAAKLTGDVPYPQATGQLVELLGDPSLRVRFFAAQALGRIGIKSTQPPLVAMLAANNGEDVYLAQAGAIALARLGDEAALGDLAEHDSTAVRTAAVVALRRLQSPLLTRFLQDDSEFVVTNAARAIGDDQFVEAAMPALAVVLEQDRFLNEPLLRRAINANLYTGTRADAERLVNFALRGKASGELRAEALGTLAVWPSSSIFDRVTGRHRGEVNNNPNDARGVLASAYSQLLGDSSEWVRESTVLALGQLGFDNASERLLQVLEQDAAPKVRVAALATLQKLNYADIGDAVFTAFNDDHQAVRMAALGMLPGLDLPVAQVVEMHALLLENGDLTERQAALISLANVDAPEAHRILAHQLLRLIDGEMAPEVQLELITAAKNSGTPELLALLARYENNKNRNNPLEVYQEALRGGDAAQGREVFRHNSTAQCVRCHIVGERGNRVGPELTDIGARLPREVLLEALVDPAARIAPGFGRITAVMADGRRVEGLFEAETDTTMTIVSGDDEREQISKADVAEVETSVSGMPPMGQLLSREELRDLVEYLTTLRGGEEEQEVH